LTTAERGNDFSQLTDIAVLKNSNSFRNPNYSFPGDHPEQYDRNHSSCNNPGDITVKVYWIKCPAGDELLVIFIENGKQNQNSSERCHPAETDNESFTGKSEKAKTCKKPVFKEMN
jgi:hypothetical protein